MIMRMCMHVHAYVYACSATAYKQPRLVIMTGLLMLGQWRLWPENLPLVLKLLGPLHPQDRIWCKFRYEAAHLLHLLTACLPHTPSPSADA